MKFSKIIVWVGVVALITVFIFLYPSKNKPVVQINGEGKTFKDGGVSFKYPERFTNVGRSEQQGSVATFVDSESPLVAESKMAQISLLAFELKPETVSKSALQLMNESFAAIFEDLKNKKGIESYSIEEKSYNGQKVALLASVELVQGSRVLTKIFLFKTKKVFYLLQGLALESDQVVLDSAMDNMLDTLGFYDPGVKNMAI